MKWDEPEYQRIASVEARGKDVAVLFEDGSHIDIDVAHILPPDLSGLDSRQITFNPHELIFNLRDGGTLEVPWTTLRSLTDKEFNEHIVKTAEKDAKSIGIRLKELREARGISSKELAERAGITPQSLSRIENGRHDVVFTSLSKILAAMNCTLKDLAVTDTPVTTWDGFIKVLDRIGLPKDFVLNRLADSDPKNRSVASTAARIGRVYGWSPTPLLRGCPPDFDVTAMGNTRFKKFGRTNEIRATAYTLYAHWVALKAIEATPKMRMQDIPKDARKIRTHIISKYGNLTFETLLTYAWDRGIVIVPLSDPGIFHGACWKIGERVAIVLKQASEYLARWLYDLSHETGHVAKHLTGSHPTLIETQEITPLSKENEEVEANDFAEKLLFEGKVEELTQRCVDRAKGDLRRLKSAAVYVAEEQKVPVDWIANYLAFRLSMQGENWWGTANNLQVKDPQPLHIAREAFRQRVELHHLSSEDRALVLQALEDK